MRTILSGLLLAVILNLGMFAAAARFPDRADVVAGAVCASALGDWVCRPDAAAALSGETPADADEAAPESVEVIDIAGNRMFCPLTGCCSGKSGANVLDLETGKVICKNGEPSPTCSCQRLTSLPAGEPPAPQDDLAPGAATPAEDGAD